MVDEFGKKSPRLPALLTRMCVSFVAKIECSNLGFFRVRFPKLLVWSSIRFKKTEILKSLYSVDAGAMETEAGFYSFRSHLHPRIYCK